MKKLYIPICALFLFTNISYAEKIECHLLSPMQKVIYKAYCQAEAKKAAKATQTSEKSSNSSFTKIKEKTGSLMKTLKVNTDSKLFKTGKYSEKK